MKSDRSGAVQFGALPWRRLESGLEVMLLTSRETRRWVIPRGWPILGCEPPECAAHEAYEEGGIEGRVSASIGTYVYEKMLKTGDFRSLTVEVFPLEVGAELIDWPEASERTRRWFSLAEAAALVDEPDLAALIRGFTPPAQISGATSPATGY